MFMLLLCSFLISFANIPTRNTSGQTKHPHSTELAAVQQTLSAQSRCARVLQSEAGPSAAEPSAGQPGPSGQDRRQGPARRGYRPLDDQDSGGVKRRHAGQAAESGDGG